MLLLSVLLGSHSIGQEVVYLVSSYVLCIIPCPLGDPGFGSPHDLILLIGLPSGITPDHWCAHEFHLQVAQRTDRYLDLSFIICSLHAEHYSHSLEPRFMGCPNLHLFKLGPFCQSQTINIYVLSLKLFKKRS